MVERTDLYLDLIQKTITYSLWEEPGVPIDAHASRCRAPNRWILRTVARLLGTMGLQLVRRVRYSEEQREKGLIWPMQADTMVGRRRLDNLRMCLEDVLHSGVKGDLIETGVWRGGASIFMKAVLTAHGDFNRRLFVADSFQGLPAAGPEDSEVLAAWGEQCKGLDAVPLRNVQDNMRVLGIDEKLLVYHPGWFSDTVPGCELGPIALLRLDGDLYDSTRVTMEHLYPKLMLGGFCIIDDWGLSGCRKAVDDYFSDRAQKIDCPVCWQKSHLS